MTIAFEVGICHLLAKFTADALIVLGLLQSARAVAVLFTESLADHAHDLLVFIQTDRHAFPHMVNFVPFGVSMRVTPRAESSARIASARA